MKYNEITSGGMPSRSLLYSRICEHLRMLIEDCAMLGHLHRATDASSVTATGWLAMAELFQRALAQVTKLAANKLS